jgi:hypothetical protein
MEGGSQSWGFSGHRKQTTAKQLSNNLGCSLTCTEIDSNRMDAIGMKNSKIFSGCWARIQTSDARCVTKLNSKTDIFEVDVFEKVPVPFLRGNTSSSYRLKDKKLLT